jgi:hypothetical protein
MAADSMTAGDRGQQRRVRRSALLWALVAGSFYVGFIIMTLVRGWK